jgi:hypothetical protein
MIADRRKRVTRRSFKLTLFLLLAPTIAMQIECGKPRKATVEAVEGGKDGTLPFSFAALDGRRDGARVSAAVVFAGQRNGDRLDLNLLLDLGPPIHLASGTYQMREGDRTRAGRVESLSLDFEAGQSGGMSLGGRFLLISSSGVTRYRVFLPSTPFDSAYR